MAFLWKWCEFYCAILMYIMTVVAFADSQKYPQATRLPAVATFNYLQDYKATPSPRFHLKSNVLFPQENQSRNTFYGQTDDKFKPQSINYVKKGYRFNILKAMKDKILQMIEDCKRNIDSQIDIVGVLHRLFKDDSAYKLGYLTSYITQSYATLNKMYERGVRSKDSRNGLLVMHDTYEKMLKYKYAVNKLLSAVSSSETRSAPGLGDSAGGQYLHEMDIALDY